MSAYKIALIIAVMIICIFLWVCFNEVVTIVSPIFNGMVNATATPDVIERNNMATSVFYWTLLIIIIVCGIWILKGTLESDEEVIQYG